MAIPDYQALMLPLLRALADGEEHHINDLTADLAARFRLTAEEERELLPSGKQPVFRNRVGWARTYLKKAGLVESVARGRRSYADRPGKGGRPFWEGLGETNA